MYYKDMEVWKEAINLVTNIYKITESYPKSELFGLVNQMRRSVVSVVSNIAEGSVKHSKKETLRFLDIAFGSLAELDTQIIVSKNLGFLNNEEDIENRLSKVQALLKGLMNYCDEKILKN